MRYAQLAPSNLRDAVSVLDNWQENGTELAPTAETLQSQPYKYNKKNILLLIL